jgi:hypothetical protein
MMELIIHNALHVWTCVKLVPIISHAIAVKKQILNLILMNKYVNVNQIIINQFKMNHVFFATLTVRKSFNLIKLFKLAIIYFNIRYKYNSTKILVFKNKL